MALVEPVVPQWSLGERLAKARRDAGLDQEDMAERLGVSRAAVSLWEQDRTQPRHYMEKLNEWADVTGVPVWWLLGVAVPTVGDELGGLGIKTRWDWETPAPLPLVHPAQGALALSSAA